MTDRSRLQKDEHGALVLDVTGLTDAEVWLVLRWMAGRYWGRRNR